MKKLLLLFFISILCVDAYPQVTSPIASDTLRKDALNVYMDATDYIKKEIPFVNYIRDIKDAGVYIISTNQRTGSGGIEYTYFFVGQNENAGMRDTLSFTASPDDTQEIVRINQVRVLKMGLMRYVAKTPLSKYMNISFTLPLSETVSSDKWDSWVFRTSLNGYVQGQQTYRSSYVSGDLTASRITKDWKFNVRSRYSYSEDMFEIDGEKIYSGNTSKSINSLLVKSITDHWSLGGTVYIGSSKYNNDKLNLRMMPGIEYDLFPYSESTRRQLRLLYSVGYNIVNYYDTTIYNKISENYPIHSLDIAYEVVQKWGSIEVSLDYTNCLQKWSLYNISNNLFMNLRVFKGLSVNIGGGASLIHDQLGLVRGGATKEEILLRRKEIATSFDYFVSFGLSFTFGSIYNNVVNPRFGNSNGGGMMISF
ncbi:MAG: hypothetical protein ACM3NR_00820 [Methanosarcina sp.]